MKLQVTGQRRRIAAGAEDAFLAELHARKLRHEKVTAAAWPREVIRSEPPGERQAAEGADQRPFLVGEVDGLE